MKIANVSYSLSSQPRTLEEWRDHLLTEIQSFIEGGTEIILYPELFLMGLTDYFPGELEKQCRDISEYVSKKLLPEIKQAVAKRDVLICLGSGPRLFRDKIFNSSPVFCGGEWSFQDKLHLTPWETSFTAGDEVKIFSFKNITVAALICFDVEQPSLALKLKEKGVHLLLVPSATSDRNGSNRVNRCANARSVELGAAVITSPLIGDSACDLVDHNEGRQGFFLPAQAVVTCEQESYSAYAESTKVVQFYQVEAKLLLSLKVADEETKPYLKKDLAHIRLSRHSSD